MTTIEAAIPAGGATVTLDLYDLGGRRVHSVFEGPLAAGAHRFTVDGRDARGGCSRPASTSCGSRPPAPGWFSG